MAHYIAKDALVAEIEKKLTDILACKKDTSNPEERIALTNMLRLCKEILSILDTLKVKEVDFRKELDKEWDNCEPTDEGMGLEIASIEHEQFDNIAKHFFELGLKAQKGE